MVARVIKNEMSFERPEEAVKSFLEPKVVVESEPVAKPGLGLRASAPCPTRARRTRAFARGLPGYSSSRRPKRSQWPHNH